MFEGIYDVKVVKTIADGLRESDKMFMELEEKRRESEVQQRREERQFQLQLAQLLAGQARAPTEFHSPSYYSDYSTQLYGPHPAPYYPQ